MKIFLFPLLMLLAWPFTNAQADARLIIHLTDYLANDYAGAVSEDGKVLSDVEYAEQVEFSQTALKEGQTDNTLNTHQDLLKKLEALKDGISEKKGPSVIVPLAREIQQQVIKVSKIALAPAAWPNYKKAKQIFESQCIRCHGVEGRGDGPDGVGLDPAPADFHDLERAPIVSPFAAFNTIRLGVPGTGMVAFSELSDQDIWSLAYYVSTFRFGETQKSRTKISEKIPNEVLLEKSAALNDEELAKFLKEKNEDESLVKTIRLYDFESSTSDFFNKAKSLLDDSVNAFKTGDFASAEKLSLDAYFLGIEPVENKIAVNDPSAVTRIEESMANFRKAIKIKNEELIVKSRAELEVEISALDDLLGGQAISPAFAFVSGFSIILREGFEAILVILAILGVAKASGSALVAATVHAGWVISVVLGVILWFVSGFVMDMSGVSREVMEALAAFFAVFVLLYVGFWMHRQTEISRWKEFINVKVKNLTETKNLLGLFTLAFVVTFREVIETVIFLRTIYVDTESDIHTSMFSGVLVAFVIIIIVSIIMTKYRNKISLQKFFGISSVLMMMLATTLAGKGVHALQEAAIFSMTPFPLKLRVELLGIFPSWEVMLTQVTVLILSILLWKRAGKKS